MKKNYSAILVLAMASTSMSIDGTGNVGPDNQPVNSGTELNNADSGNSPERYLPCCRS